MSYKSKNLLSDKFFLCLLGLVIFAMDFATKYLTQKHIPVMNSYRYPYGGIEVFKNFLGIEFSLVHTTNRGAAWGLFSDFQFYLVCLRFVLVTGLIIYLLFYNKCKNIVIPLVLISFGALGNIVDYFLYGHVIDMFHFVLWGYDFPVFNVADSAICIGIFWLVLASWKPKELQT